MEDNKMTVVVPEPIPGWDCIPAPILVNGEPAWQCTPSDEYIRVRAYFRYVTRDPDGATDFANWITAEEDFINAMGNNLPPLG